MLSIGAAGALLGAVAAPALGAAAAGVAGQLLGVRTGLALGCTGILLSPAWTLGLGGALLRRGVRIDVPR